MPVRVPVRGTRARVYGTRAPAALPEFVPEIGGSGDVLHTFTAENWSASSSPAVAMFGLGFDDGLLPAGTVPALRFQGGADIASAQFDAPTRWPSGAIQHIRGMFVDSAAFTGSQSKTIECYSKTGTLDTSTTLTLADLQAPDFNVLLTNRTEVGTSGESGALPDLEIRFNDMLATRQWRFREGPSVLGYTGWQMAHELGGGAQHDHIKGYPWIMAVKDPAGGIAGYWVTFTVGQDWYKNPFGTGGKKRQKFTIKLRAGSTVLVDYGAVSCHYMAHMFTVDKSGAPAEGRPVWYPGTQAKPTLHIKPDQAAWKASGLVPNYSLRFPASTNSYTTTYTPFGAMAHELSTDAAGAHMGRGVIGNVAVQHFYSRSATDWCRAQVSALAIGGYPCHQRSHHTRTIPGQGSADIASSVIVLKQDPKSPSEYDYTADGLPAAVDAYGPDNRTDPSFRDGYEYPEGGTSPWSTGIDNSHLDTYALYTCLMGGYDFLADEQVDLSIFAINRCVLSNYNGRPRLLGYNDANWEAELGPIPDTQWGGVTFINSNLNLRGNGFSIVAMTAMALVVPENHHAYNYIRDLSDHNADFASTQMDYLPADHIEFGKTCWNNNGSWMFHFHAIGGAYAYRTRKHLGWKKYLDVASKWQLNPIRSAPKRLSQYVCPWHLKVNSFAFWSQTNSFYDTLEEWGQYLTTCSAPYTDVSGNWVGITARVGDDYQVGDVVRFRDDAESPVATTLGVPGSPTPLYVVEVGTPVAIPGAGANAVPLRLSLTPGGSVLDITGAPVANDDNTCGYFAARDSDPVVNPMTDFWETPGGDTRVGMANMALAMAYNAGAADITLADVELLRGWYDQWLTANPGGWNSYDIDPRS